MNRRYPRCLLLFSRAPAADARLKGISAAFPLFEASFRRAASLAASLIGVDLVVVGAVPARLPTRVHRLPQRGAGFGVRLANAFADVCALGYVEIVVIPGDVPGLSVDHLRAAFRHVARGRTALGPCPDGGVYLIGARGSVEALFHGVRWQTGAVLSDLHRRAPDPVLLTPLGDLDRWRDLGRLAVEDGLDDGLRALIRVVRASSARRARASALPFVRSEYASAASTRGPPPTQLACKSADRLS